MDFQMLCTSNTEHFPDIKIQDNSIRVQTFIVIEKWLLSRCIQHFKSDSINNMDHMRIAGT